MINAPRYFNTNQAILDSKEFNQALKEGSLETIDLAQAMLKGQAPDGGLYLPTHFPSMSPSIAHTIGTRDYPHVFAGVVDGFFEGVLSRNTLEEIAQGAYGGAEGFEPIIEEANRGRDYIVRLDEGPTLAFKDYAAQVLFRITEELMKEKPETEIGPDRLLRDVELLTYITATSGDTGSAMGQACLDIDRMCMFILHSSLIGDEISDLQAKQISVLSGERIGSTNIYPMWVNTDFDGCQKIVQDLLKDKDLQYMDLNSANSINIGRLLPQIPYYFFAYSRIANTPDEEVYFAVPSGNFGNAVAGLIAQRMGLPIKLIIGVNENDVFDRYFHTGEYSPANYSKSSPSNSMNVNWPSNIRRLVQFGGGQLIESKDPDNPDKKIVDPSSYLPDPTRMKDQIVASYRISDADTDDLIWQFYQEWHMLNEIHSTIEPHGAVAWGAAQRFRQDTGYEGKIAVFETAHPGKFPDSLVDKGIDILMPPNLARLVGRPHGAHLTREPNYQLIKATIMELHGQELAKYK